MIRNAAMEYAALGYSVVPVQPRGKRPALESWAMWQQSRADETKINEWWDSMADANVGIVCGAVSGRLVVIDVDGPSNTWPAGDGELPECPVGITGGGGRHYFMRMPDGVDIRNSARRLAPGVDIRGEGGFVVVPPSVHQRTGQPYRWGIDLDIACDELPEVPDWVVKRLLTPGGGSVIAPEEFAAILTTRMRNHDGRNEAAARLAGRYFARGMPIDEVMAILGLWNGNHHEPMAEKELRSVVESIGLRELANAPPTDIPDEEISDEQRSSWIEAVAAFTKIPIQATYRIEGDDPQFEIRVPDGKITMPVSDLVSPAQFSRACVKLANRLPVLPSKTNKQMSYNKIVNHLLRGAKRIDTGVDATEEGLLRQKIDAYLADNEPMPPENAYSYESPLVADGDVWVSLTGLHKHLRRRYDYRDSERRLAQWLRGLGMECRRFRIKPEGRIRTRQVRYYKIVISHNEDGSDE